MHAAIAAIGAVSEKTMPKLTAQRRRLLQRHPENGSGTGTSSQSMPNLLSQLARRLSSNKVTTSGLKLVDRLDVECILSNQLQILHSSPRK